MEKIPDIYEKLKPRTQEIMDKFSKTLFKEEDINLEEFKFAKLFNKYSNNLEEAINEINNLWQTKENIQTLGHDNIHIAYDLFEFLKLMESKKFKESEKYMVLLGSLLHDLGRYPELLFRDRSGAMDFNKPKKIQFHAALSGYIGSILAKIYKNKDEKDPDIIEASKSLNRRIISASLFHGGKNEERDPVVHHVQSIDRLSGILGTREFVRNIVSDGVLRGAPIYPDESLSYNINFPLFNNLPVEKFNHSENPEGSWTNIIHYIEMPMRNMYKLSTNLGENRAKSMKRESGIILTLLSGGENSKLYKEIFSPELNIDKIYNFPKTKLPLEIWDAIKNGINYEEADKMANFKNVNSDLLIDIMLEQQAPYISNISRKKVHKLFSDVPEYHLDDINKTLKYVVVRRFLNKEDEKKFLLFKKESNDRIMKLIAKILLENKLFN